MRLYSCESRRTVNAIARSCREQLNTAAHLTIATLQHHFAVVEKHHAMCKRNNFHDVHAWVHFKGPPLGLKVWPLDYCKCVCPDWEPSVHVEHTMLLIHGLVVLNDKIEILFQVFWITWKTFSW